MLLEGERAERKKFGGVLCLVVVLWSVWVFLGLLAFLSTSFSYLGPQNFLSLF